MNRKETLLNQDKLFRIMTGIHEKVENQQIQNDEEMIHEVIDDLKPIYQHHQLNMNSFS